MVKITAGMAANSDNWRLLIYTVPAQPSRKRAFIWRELKKAGAVYLRDGVCALPERPETAAVLSAVAAKVEFVEVARHLRLGEFAEIRAPQSTTHQPETPQLRESRGAGQNPRDRLAG